MTKNIFELNHAYFLAQFGDDKVFEIVSDSELANGLFRLDALNSIREIVLPLPHRVCTDYSADLYRDLDGYFVDETGVEVYLDLEPLWDAPDEWWRDTVQTITPRTEAIRLRVENKERLRVLFSLYRACYPMKAMLWSVRPHNDNQVAR